MAFSVKEWLNRFGAGTEFDQPTDTGDDPDTPADAGGLRDLEERLSGYTDSQVSAEATARGTAVAAKANTSDVTTALAGKADLSSGHVPVAQLGSGTPASGKYVDGASGAWLSLPAQSGSAAATTFTPAGNIAASNVQAALEELDAEKPGRPTLTTKTADYTFVLGDAWNKVYLSGTTGRSFTVPTNASVAFPVGTEIEIGELGTGALTVAAAGGVTVDKHADGTLVLNGAGSVASLLKTATNTWLLTGQLVPS